MPETIRRIVGQFYECLVEGGTLVVGHAESNVELFRSFRTVNVPGAVLYQKAATSPKARHLPSGASDLDVKARSTKRHISPMLNDLPAQENKSKRPERIPIASSAVKQTPSWPESIPERITDIRAKADCAQWQEAARSCEELIATDRLNPTAHFYHALMLEQMSQHAEAEKALRRTIYLDRHFVLAHYHLGLLLQKKFDVAGAERSFRNTIQLLDRMNGKQTFTDADGLTVGALKQLTQTHLEILCRS